MSSLVIKFKIFPQENKVKAPRSLIDLEEYKFLLSRLKKAINSKKGQGSILGNINKNKKSFRYQMIKINDVYHVELSCKTHQEQTPPPIPCINDYLESFFEKIAQVCMAREIKVNFHPLDTEVLESELLFFNKNSIDETVNSLLQYFTDTKENSFTVTPLIKDKKFHLIFTLNGALIDLTEFRASAPLISALNNVKNQNTKIQLKTETDLKHKLHIEYQLRNI